MNTRTRIAGALIITVAAVALVGCGSVTELVLDDAWALEEIQAGSLIATDLNEYLAVSFDATDDTAEFTVGPQWGSLATQDPTGTYTFDVNAADNEILFMQGGDVEHIVTYEFDAQLGQMDWNRWEAVGVDPDVLIVSDASTIRRITFSRVE